MRICLRKSAAVLSHSKGSGNSQQANFGRFSRRENKRNSDLSRLTFFLKKAECIDKSYACCQLPAPQCLNNFFKDRSFFERLFQRLAELFNELVLGEILDFIFQYGNQMIVIAMVCLLQKAIISRTRYFENSHNVIAV